MSKYALLQARTAAATRHYIPLSNGLGQSLKSLRLEWSGRTRYTGKWVYSREKGPFVKEIRKQSVCLSTQWCPALGLQTRTQAVSCRSCGLSSVWSIDLSIPAGDKGSPHTWKPFSCSCSSWRRRVCMLLMIRLWWPSSSTPTCLTSLRREEKHTQRLATWRFGFSSKVCKRPLKIMFKIIRVPS